MWSFLLGKKSTGTLKKWKKMEKMKKLEKLIYLMLVSSVEGRGT